MEQSKFKRQVRHFFKDNHTIETVIAVLIVVSVALVFAEFFIPAERPYYPWIVVVSDILTGIFAAELVLRYYAANRKWEFFKTFWYDIIAVMPGLRVLRFVRLLRVMRLHRPIMIWINRAAYVFPIFKVVRIEYLIIALALLTATLMGAISMHQAEGLQSADFSTLERTLWYAIMTIIAGEPTGGDPSTSIGRAVTLLLMVSGLTLFAIFTGTVSAVVIDTLKDVRLVVVDIEDLRKHVVICGWNASGPVLVKELLEDERKVKYVIITERELPEVQKVVDSMPNRVVSMVGDYTRIDCLKDARIEFAERAILLADATIAERSTQDQDARTVLAAMLVERLCPGIYTIVQLNNRDNEASLKSLEVEEIIVADEYVGYLVATMTRNRGIVAMINELLAVTLGDQFFRSKVPSELVGMDVGTAIPLLKRDYDALLLAVDCQNGKISENSVKVNPPSDFLLEEHHYLFIAAAEPLEAGSKRKKRQPSRASSQPV